MLLLSRFFTLTILMLTVALGAASVQASIYVASADYRIGGTPGGGVPIVDNASLSRSIFLSAPAVSIIADVNITIDFTKSNFGINSTNGVPTLGGTGSSSNTQIVFQLTSPQGTTVNLVNAGTYFGQQGSATGVVDFDDSAADVVDGFPDFSSTFRPVGSLADFNGEFAAGNYTLFFQDTAGGDPLSVNAWSIQVAAVPEPTTFVVWSLLGAASICGCRRKTRA